MVAVDNELTAANRFVTALALTQPVIQADWATFDMGARRMLGSQPQLTSISVVDLVAERYVVHTMLAPGQRGPAGPNALAQGKLVAEARQSRVFGVRVTGPTIPDVTIPVRAPILRDGQVREVLTVTLSPAHLHPHADEIAELREGVRFFIHSSPPLTV